MENLYKRSFTPEEEIASPGAQLDINIPKQIESIQARLAVLEKKEKAGTLDDFEIAERQVLEPKLENLKLHS